MARWEIYRDPWLSEFSRLQKSMSNLFSELNEGSVPTSEFLFGKSRLFPPINVQKQQDNYKISAEIPGVKSDEIELTVHGDTLTIKGERKPDPSEQGASYHRRERSHGAFQRCISLPEKVDSENIGATYKNGVLTITLPLDKIAGPKKISVATE